MGGQFSLEHLGRQLPPLFLGTEPLHGFEQRVMVGLRPGAASRMADDASLATQGTGLFGRPRTVLYPAFLRSRTSITLMPITVPSESKSSMTPGATSSAPDGFVPCGANQTNSAPASGSRNQRHRGRDRSCGALGRHRQFERFGQTPIDKSEGSCALSCPLPRRSQSPMFPTMRFRRNWCRSAFPRRSTACSLAYLARNCL